MYRELTIDNESMSFVERVMKENLWDKIYTLRVIEEYKKFIELGSIQSVAPSREIDQVWHAHLLYSKDYDKMCDRLGFFFHHNPTPKELVKTIGKDAYVETIKLYRKVFQYDPPADIWTRWKDKHYAYVDVTDNWVIPKKDWKLQCRLLWRTLIG